MNDHVVIAHGGDVSQPSGGTNRVSAFASGLVEHGYDVTLVVPQPEDELPDRLSTVDIRPVSVPNSGLADQPIRAVAITHTAKRIASQTDATVQFEHSTLGGVGQLLGVRGYVLDMHDLAFESPLYGNIPLGSAVQRVIRRVEGRAVRSADEIVVVSENMRDLAHEAWGIDRASITVIQNGYFANEVTTYRTAETVSGRVSFLGTLHPKLNVDAIFEIAQLSEVEELVVIGDGAKREALEAGKSEHSLDALRVAGRLPDEEAFDLVAKSAVAINPQLPSDLQRASSPVKIYYYAALGAPMVLSEGPSVATALEDKGGAVVVPFEESFPDAVQAVLRDDAQRREMSETAARAAERMSWQSRVESLTRLY